jgi:hypothetical protein
MAVLIDRIQKIGPTLGGVFSYADLFNLIGAGSVQRNQRTIKRLIREGVLFKIRRGLYSTKNPDLWVLGCHIRENAYVSMDSVLSKNLLIGTVPKGSVSLVYTGLKRRRMETPFGLLRFFSIKKDLVFGTTRLPNGVAAADNEKAYLDILYYYSKGARFVIDPLKEINVRKLNRKKVAQYLKKYRNPRFVAFVEGRLRERD